MKLVDVAALTDVGRVRERNEDAYLCMPEVGVLAVADGMGGLSHGGLASSTAVGTIEDAADALGRLVEEVAEAPTSLARRQLAQALEFLAQMAARRLQQNVQGRPSGTTLVSVVLAGEHLVLCHIGDSRAYLLRSGELTMVTEDHTVAAARVRSGTMTEAEHDTSPLQHILYQALGTSGESDPDLLDVPLAHDDVLLLCSDGLSGLISDDDIRELLVEAPSLEIAASRLVAAANDAGGRDNITVVLARIDGGPGAEARSAREVALASNPVFGELNRTERRLLELYLDEAELVPGQQVAGDNGLSAVLAGEVRGADGAPRHAVGLLGLCGDSSGSFDVATASSLCTLSPAAFEELEPRRPALAARLLRSVLREIGTMLAAGAAHPL